MYTPKIKHTEKQVTHGITGKTELIGPQTLCISRFGNSFRVKVKSKDAYTQRWCACRAKCETHGNILK